MGRMETKWIALAGLAGLAACGLDARAAEVTVDALMLDGFETPAATVYRVGEMKLRDPHAFYTIGICLDVTDLIVNPQIAQALTADSDADGYYDSSPLLVLRPRDDSGRPARIEDRGGDCTVGTAPICTPNALASASGGWYASFELGSGQSCLEAIPNTVSTWSGAAPVPAPGGHCLSSTPRDQVLALGGGLVVPLWDTQVGAPWPGTVGSTGGALLRGFLRESDAALITVPYNNQQIPLSSMLPDGAGSCRTNVARGKDVHRGESGWWFYFETRLDAVDGFGF